MVVYGVVVNNVCMSNFQFCCSPSTYLQTSVLQTGTSYVNHTLIFTPGAFNLSNHYSSLNLIGHVHIPTSVTKTMPEWPDPPSACW